MKNSHYRIFDLIGEGQFGRVFSGIHRETGELVALKELNPQVFSTKKFLKEIRILLSLNHPNVVSCQGVKHNNCKRYLLTEYCESGTLRDLIELNKNLNLRSKLNLIIDILNGLNHIHSHRIIHRDLKPENVLLSIVSNGWVAKITDFGIAKIDGENGNTDIGLGDTGSPAYMAPEQFYGKYSYSCDLYAVGIILYELLIGKRPFSGTPNEIMISHLNKLPIIPDFLPLELRNTLNTALQKLPKNRFNSAKDFLGSLTQAQSNLNLNQESFLFDYSIENFNTNYSSQCTLLSQDKISNSVDKLLIVDNQFYSFHELNNFWGKYNINSSNFSFKRESTIKVKNNLIDIHFFENEAVVLTKEKMTNSDKYIFYKVFPNLAFKSLFSFEATDLIYTIDTRQKWLALSKKNSSKISFIIIKLSNLEIIKPILEEVYPDQLITLDNHHGLAVFYQHQFGQNTTLLKFFTRRGNWTQTFSLALFLKDFTVNVNQINYLLAVETDRELDKNLALILISIKPFKVVRICLEIEPHFIISHGDAFLIASNQGQMIQIDLRGQILNKISLHKQITAIASLSEKAVLVATTSGQEKNLQVYFLE